MKPSPTSAFGPADSITPCTQYHPKTKNCVPRSRGRVSRSPELVEGRDAELFRALPTITRSARAPLLALPNCADECAHLAADDTPLCAGLLTPHSCLPLLVELHHVMPHNEFP